nr:retrovirus-related Pol polyprotein [Tanacetum cinerariifolium]
MQQSTEDRKNLREKKKKEKHSCLVSYRIDLGGSLSNHIHASPSNEKGNSKSLIVVLGNSGCLNVEATLLKKRSIAKDASFKVGVFHFSADFVVVDFEPDPPSPLNSWGCFLKTGRALIDVHKGELTLRIRNEAITYNLDQTVRYSANYNQMTANKIDVIYEEYSQEVFGFSDTTASGNPTPHDDPIVSTTSPTLTLFGDSDFLLFEEVDAFLGLEDDPDSPKINPFYYDPEGDILLLETILNSEPLPPLSNHEQYLPSFKKKLKVCEAKTVKSFVDEPPEVEIKDLPPHLKYAFLEGDNKLPVIISKELGDEEKSALIKVLKSHKRAIAWKLYDIQGINPKFCTHKIQMEEDYKPAMQHQRRVNPKIHDFIKKEVEKLLDAGLIYPISNSPWVSPTMEVFMDDFSVFGNSFKNCLSHLNKMLQRCEDTNLSLNWERSHFMVKEGIVLGHKISKNEIEVDRAKVDVIAKLPHPTTVKGVRSFLGHADFYRRFIQDFSKISRPMTHLLEKNTPFIFSEDCIKAFQTLKKKLTEAPILIVPNWNLPFELCATQAISPLVRSWGNVMRNTSSLFIMLVKR